MSKNLIDKIVSTDTEKQKKFQMEKERSLEEKETINKIADLFRNNKIDEIIVAGEKTINPETKDRPKKSCWIANKMSCIKL